MFPQLRTLSPVWSEDNSYGGKTGVLLPSSICEAGRYIVRLSANRFRNASSSEISVSHS